MPSIEAIDRIKNVVNSFGNEEAILQQRGASIEDVLPPEGGVDDELQDLMAPTVDSDDLGTVDSLLSSLDEETGDSGFDLSGPEEEIFSDEPEEDEEESIDLGGLDDLEDLGGLDDLEDFSVQEEPDEDLADDLDGMDDLGGLDDLDGVEDLAGLNDDDLNTLDDLGEIDDGDIAGLGEMEDLEDLGSLEDLGGEDFSDEDDIPDTEAALENLAQSLEEDEPFGGGEDDGGEEIVLDEDFGLSEIDDDFLDDLNDDEGNQFSLDDLGSEYNFTEDDTDASGDLGFDLDELENDINQTVASEAALNFEISHGDLEKLEAALYGLPLNLKIAVQDFLSDDASTVDQLEKMIDLVTRDVPPRQIAQLYKNFTGKQVDIPRGYEKKSGDDFARERNSPSHIRQ